MASRKPTERGETKLLWSSHDRVFNYVKKKLASKDKEIADLKVKLGEANAYIDELESTIGAERRDYEAMRKRIAKVKQIRKAFIWDNTLGLYQYFPKAFEDWMTKGMTGKEREEQLSDLAMCCLDSDIMDFFIAILDGKALRGEEK